MDTKEGERPSFIQTVKKACPEGDNDVQTT